MLPFNILHLIQQIRINWVSFSTIKSLRCYSYPFIPLKDMEQMSWWSFLLSDEVEAGGVAWVET